MTQQELIQELKTENKELQELIHSAQETLSDINCYVQSSKFDENPYVHKNDIILRLREVMSFMAFFNATVGN